LGAGIFFIGYTIFEIPSNAGMHRFGARKWIARILVTWGLFATIMAAVQGETSFYIVRFLLGAAEAGFFPAVILYLTYWFPAAQRVVVLGTFILAQPLANAIGAPVSGLLLKMDGIWGLAGWQWIYIIEGLPAILMGFVVLGVMTDRPKDAKWLAADERRWLQDTMAAEDAAKASAGGHSFMAGLKNRRALIFAGLYFGLVSGIYGLSLWLPTIVKAMGTLSTTQIGFIVAVPYMIAAVFVYYWSRHSDRTGERVAHSSLSMLLGAAGLVTSGFLLQSSPVLAMVAITVAAMGIFSAISPFWELPAGALAGAAAASGIALVNSVGNLGGFAAPYAVGALIDRTGDGKYGLLLLAAVLFITAVATFVYGRKVGAGRVPTASRVDVLAKEAAAFDLLADEPHQRVDNAEARR
jgi:ACS family tartrate transporter-like MFS transporter